MAELRTDDGRFATGNPGGPGRPRRAIEADYLKAFSDAVPLDAWRTIVSRAVADAQGPVQEQDRRMTALGRLSGSRSDARMRTTEGGHPTVLFMGEFQAGDARARDWMARHVLRNEPPSLVSIAATEARAAKHPDRLPAVEDDEALPQFRAIAGTNQRSSWKRQAMTTTATSLADYTNRCSSLIRRDQ